MISLIFFNSIFVLGQMNLEKTFITSNPIFIFNDNNNAYYYCFSYGSTSDSLKIYNPDFSLYKNIALKQYPGYKVSTIYYPSFHLFNTDNSLEYICSYFNSSNSNNLTKLFDENGNELMDFGNCEYVLIFKASDNVYKLLTFLYARTDTFIISPNHDTTAIQYNSSVTKIWCCPREVTIVSIVPHHLLTPVLCPSGYRDVGTHTLKGTRSSQPFQGGKDLACLFVLGRIDDLPLLIQIGHTFTELRGLYSTGSYASTG